MSGHAWASEPLTEWAPWLLPGYAVAVAAIKRGDRPFWPGWFQDVTVEREPAHVTPAAPRVPRVVDVAELRVQLAAAITARDAVFDRAGAPERAAAWMNQTTVSGRAMAKKAHARIDSDIDKHKRLVGRIARLERQIQKAEAGE